MIPLKKLFLDMDGVLADFDAGYAKAFGIEVSKEADNANWTLVRGHKGFYKNLPLMPDAMELWEFAKRYKPTILTGVPSSVAEAAANKIAWVRKHLGPDVPVIACLAREKYLHAKGAVLVDDWEKYMHKWLAAGGEWITHKSAAESIAALKTIMEE